MKSAGQNWRCYPKLHFDLDAIDAERGRFEIRVKSACNLQRPYRPSLSSQKMALAMGSRDHGKTGQAALSRLRLQDHRQLVGVEQAGQPGATIVVSWLIQIFRLPNLRHLALLPKIIIHRLMVLL